MAGWRTPGRGHAAHSNLGMLRVKAHLFVDSLCEALPAVGMFCRVTTTTAALHTTQGTTVLTTTMAVTSVGTVVEEVMAAVAATVAAEVAAEAADAIKQNSMEEARASWSHSSVTAMIR